MQNTIRLHKRIRGERYEFMNPLNRNWIPVDGETAKLFVHNVLNYSKLPEGPSVGLVPHYRPWYEETRSSQDRAEAAQVRAAEKAQKAERALNSLILNAAAKILPALLTPVLPLEQRV